MEHDESEQIKSLLDSGYVDAARHRLEEILKADQHDMGAWLLYVNSFKTIDTRLEVLEICRRLNPDNLKVKSAIAALKMKKSADAAPAARPPAQLIKESVPDRAEEQAPWSFAPASASFVQPETVEASPPAWGYETSAKDMYKQTPSLSKEEIDRQARDYVEGRVQKKKESVSGGPLNWYEVWFTAITQPRLEAFDSLRKNPYALPSRTYLWLIIAGLVSGLVASLMVGFNPQWGQIFATAEQEFPGLMQTIQAFIFCMVPLTGVMTLINTAIAIGIQHLVAKLMGGEGKYSELLYLVAAYTAPITIITSILGIIPLVASCLAAPLGIYAVYLNYLALRSAHNLNSIKAWGVILGIALVSLVFVCLFFYLGYSYIEPFMEPYMPVQSTF